MPRIRWTASLALFGIIGCSSDPDDAISLVRVSGTITLNGKPLPNARISFIPDGGNKESTAGGDTTGPEGNYLAQFRGRNGLAPGKYKVGVESSPTDPIPANIAAAFENDPFMAAEATRAASFSKRSKKNKDEIKTEFEATVEDKPTVVDRDLKASASSSK